MLGCDYSKLTEYLIRNGLTITTMESCTSGLIASLITDTEGASAVLKGAFVTYSNEAKIRQGVPEETIEKYGVYSEETAAAMAEAAKKAFGADIAVGVTGSYRNADPANADSVPGEVYFAIMIGKHISTYYIKIASGSSRHEAKLETAGYVLRALCGILGI